MTVAPTLQEVKQIVIRLLLGLVESHAELFPLTESRRWSSGVLTGQLLECARWRAVWRPQSGVLQIFDRSTRQLVVRRNLFVRIERAVVAA